MKKQEICAEEFKTKLESFLIGCDSIEETELWDKSELGEMDAFYYNNLVSIILRFIAVDGKISQQEVDYLNNSFGFEYSVLTLKEFYDCCKDNIGRSFDAEFSREVSLLRSINIRLADAYSDLILLTCDILSQSDGCVSAVEMDSIKQLKELLIH